MTIKSMLFSIFLVAGVTGQVTREHRVVLKNWPAPLYWQPTPAESEAAGGKVHAAIRTASLGAAAEPTFLVFVAMTPCRVVDTRSSQMFAAPFGPPSLLANATRSFPIQSTTLCTIPSTAQAYSFNVTAVPPGPLGYLTIWPTGLSQPNAVTLDDFPTGDIRNNAAVVPAGTPNGSVDVHVNAATDFVLDINGYYTAPSDLNSNTALGQGALSSNTTGFSNTATGFQALFNSTTGDYNTANGYQALYNTTGNLNTASGAYTLFHNGTGAGNTASGYQALVNNTTGNNNTASGVNALFSNTTGDANTAVGYDALYSNSTFVSPGGPITGVRNTASGFQALYSNTGGQYNTASGDSALYGNTLGSNNTASGHNALYSNSANGNTASGDSALYSNTSGFENTASGVSALQKNTMGYFNTAIGSLALDNNTTGVDNTALGFQAGNLITGDNNIDIGSFGAANENGVIRIGRGGVHTSFFAAGILGATPASAVGVLIGSNGQLGVPSSSRRYKEDIQDMDDASSGLLRLRPVTYRYQKPYPDGSKPIDYGLIAEEVAEVYPDLVVKSADGQIETVQYHKLVPMLLNELQKQRREQRDRSESQEAQIAALQEALARLLSNRAASPISQ